MKMSRTTQSSSDFAFYVPGKYKPEQSLGYLMKKVLSSILQEADRRLSSFDLTYVQWLPLYKLAQNEDITLASLSRDLQIDPAAISRSLDRIESKGLIHRRRSLSDRRVVHLELSIEGREVAEDVKGVLADVLNDHLKGFSFEEWTTMLELLRRMLINGNALKDQLLDADQSA